MATAARFSVMHVILEPRYSGAETLVRDLVRIHGGQEHRTSIVAFRPPSGNFGAEMTALAERGCRAFLPDRDLERWDRLRWILAAVKEARPDIVFAHAILPSIYTRLALRFTHRPPIVTVLHSDDDLSNARLRGLERFLWKRNAFLVGVSSKSVDNYRQRITERVSARVIPNGIRVAQFAFPGAGAAQHLRARLYEPRNDEIIVVQLGRICLQKQQLVSVEGLARLSARGVRNIRLVLVGPPEDPDYKAKIVDCARQGGVEDRVQFVGPQGSVNEWMAGADIFLMPSGWESHSIAALEGLASGLFCIFSGIDPFEELRTYPGVSMMGASPTPEELAHSLETVLKGKAWQRKYERDLERFSIERCAAEYMRIAEEIVPGPIASRPRSSVTAKAPRPGSR